MVEERGGGLDWGVEEVDEGVSRSESEDGSREVSCEEADQEPLSSA
jgi:hypothetical protein